MSNLKSWAVLDNNEVVHGFDADQEYVDNYIDRVVTPEYVTTPPWYNDGVEFVDVTALSARPVLGWYRDPSGTFVDGTPKLTTDKTAISSDGISSAKVTFQQNGPKTPKTVTFSVNDQKIDETVTNGSAVLEVTSTTPGDMVNVSVGDQFVTINVVA